MTKILRFLMVLLACSFDLGESAKFLLPATSLLSMPSHYMSLTTITKALVERGHEVVLLIIDKKETKGFLPGSYTANITYANPMTDEEIAYVYKIKGSAMSILKNSTFLESVMDPSGRDFQKMMYFGCFELFKNEDTLRKLKQERFDMMLTFPVMDFCDSAIAAYLDVPYTLFTGTRRTPAFHEDMAGIPIPNSYVPFSSFTPLLTDRMNFLERVQNAFFHYGLHPIGEYFITYRPLRHLQRTYDIRQDLTPWQLITRAEIWLCHNTWALEHPRPIGPNWIPIPGLTIKKPKPLPEDLETFVQGSGEHGFIVFTLGSMTTSLASDGINDMFSKVFSELPQRVIWRYVGPSPRYLGNNTLIKDWLPQNDLLAHPKARVLIYHGGSGGVHEAIHYGVPMLLMPLAGDQGQNANLVAAKGMGLVLDPNELDEAILKTAIHDLLTEERYKANVMKGSGILRDRLASPLDTAVFWIEHVLKFGGDHLRLRSTEMGFIQLNSLDVIAFVVVLSSILIYINYLIIRGCYRCICKKTRKQKSD
ncbi:UDP-glucuronosyltransferase 2C1-like [Strongylocentrotus purpuratus]|uniref:UDP-glucuronosyltransferase n=1 Tax=Strongylocentrotus purpuratus TaxID=7668 RepID=A0A7M7HLU7_STRPU|nr:UDP-glucuronosyltransferase 2C1-like [Strongylocentrotus purpuratus]